MTTDERARKLVGDMPWVTDGLSPKSIADLRKQIATCLAVAVAEEREACAAVCEKIYVNYGKSGKFESGDAAAYCAEVIRARGK